MKTLMFFSLLILSGCVSTIVDRVGIPSGGSKSDGIIELSYSYRLMETPNIDWNQTNLNAIKRCNSWGYNDAEIFGAAETRCTNYNYNYGCTQTVEILKYQCIGEIDD